MLAVAEGLLQRANQRVGSTVAGAYRLERLLGVGGMAAVFASRGRDGGEVAVKVLHDLLALDATMRARFAREARTANRVEHPGAVPVLEDGVDAEGTAYLVMPLLEGETLAARLRRLGPTLPPREVAAIGHAIAQVLARAHDAGIVHRDLKPENVFLTRDGGVRVLDFGIARILDGQRPDAITQSGVTIGTPAFMAPEQVLARPAEPATDVWSMGATLFAALAGRQVHLAGSLGELMMLAGSRPAMPLAEVAPGVPSPLAAVVDRALAFDPRERWSDARAMGEALERAYLDAFGEPLASHAAPLPALAAVHFEPTQRFDASEPGAVAAPAVRARAARWRWGSAMAALALAGGATVLAMRAHREGDRAPAAAQADEERPSGVAQANAFYRAGMQAMHDASPKLARRDFDEAVRADPSFAAAHLGALLATFYVDDAAHQHYERALHGRGDLDARGRALLEAFEPSLRVPPDYVESVKRLGALAAARPSDAEVALALARAHLHVGAQADAIAAARRAADAEPTWASPHLAEAIGETDRGDVSAARAAYARCLALSRTAATCLQGLAEIASSEGSCAEATALSRRLIRADPDGPDGYALLARASFGESGALDAARAALEQQSARLPAEERPRRDREADATLATLAGDLDGALAAAQRWGEATASSSYDEERFRPAYAQMQLLLELGRPREAAEVARRFGDERVAGTTSDAFDFQIVPVAVRYVAGAISRETMRTEREAWLAYAASHDIAEPALRWHAAYGLAVVTAADASEALAALPKDNPFGSAFMRNAESELALGRAFLLADRVPEAAEHLAAAVATCSAVEAPVAHTQAFLALGRARERLHDRDGACAAYGRLLARWGRAPRSTSAREAAQRARALRCAP